MVYLLQGWSDLSTTPEICDNILRPALFVALAVSAVVEVSTSATGLTKSNILQVLLFASVRTGTEYWLAPLVGCGSFPHLFTALCWSIGEVVRFGCFAMDQAAMSDTNTKGSRLAKSIRYSVGPVLFPLGAGGEMSMAIYAGHLHGQPMLYAAASLWPLGFYPLMKQLLKQRRKHFEASTKKEKVIKSI